MFKVGDVVYDSYLELRGTVARIDTANHIIFLRDLVGPGVNWSASHNGLFEAGSKHFKLDNSYIAAKQFEEDLDTLLGENNE